MELTTLQVLVQTLSPLSYWNSNGGQGQNLNTLVHQDLCVTKLEWRSPLDRVVPKERFHCILVGRGLVGGMRPVKQ